MLHANWLSPGVPADDFAHLIRSDFVVAKPEKFTRNALNFAHAQTKRHQPGADGHQAAAHQPAEAAAVVCGGNRSFRARIWSIRA